MYQRGASLAAGALAGAGDGGGANASLGAGAGAREGASTAKPLSATTAPQAPLQPPLQPHHARRTSDALVDIESRFANLTTRQVEVYRAVARGLPNKLIARELGITESTVKTHLSAVYAVLGVNNRTQATFQASREGFRVR
jgi:DNA-binding NarL/FixJ family response regulator